MSTDKPVSQHERRLPRVLRFIARLLARALALVVLLTALLAVALVVVVDNAIAIVDLNLDRITAIGSAHFNRPLQIASVRGTLWPTLDIVVDGLELGSRVPGEPPLLQLPSIEVAFRTDLALWSWGKELITERVRISGGRATVHRDVEGNIDMAEVIALLPPLAPKDIQGAVIEAVDIDNIDVTYVDDKDLRLLAVHDLQLGSRHIGLGRPFDAQLRATWTGPEAPIAFTAHADFVPRDLILWPLPKAELSLTIGNIQLDDVVENLALPVIYTAGVVDVRLGLLANDDHHLQLLADVHGVGTTPPVRTGTGAGIERRSVERPIELHGVVDHDVDSGDTQLVELVASLAGIGVVGRGAFDAEGLHSLEAFADVEQLARLGLFVPGLLTTSPGAFVVAGKATGGFELHDNTFAGSFNFRRARVEIGEALQKPAGAPLTLQVNGCRGGGRCGAARASLRFGLQHGTVFTGTLLVPEAADKDTVLDLRSNTITLGEASAISPLLNDVFGTTQTGMLAAHAVGHIGSVRTTFDIDLDLTQLALNYERTSASGATQLHFDIDTDNNGLGLGLLVDASSLAITTKDTVDAVVFEKTHGDELVLTANLHEVGGRGALGQAMAGTAREGEIIDDDRLVPRWQTIIGGLAGEASVRVAHIALASIPITDVRLDLALKNGQLTINDSSLTVFSGEVKLRETTAYLTSSPVQWTVDIQAAGISAKTVLAPLVRFTGAVTGTVDIAATLSATGLSVGPLLQSLDGPLSITTHGVHLARLDIVSSWIDRFWDVVDRLPFVNHDAVARTRGTGVSGRIADATWSVHFVRDRFRFDEPLLVATSLGWLRLVGGAGFDGTIDFDARLELVNEHLEQLQISTASQPLSLRVHVGGTWAEPVWTNENFDALKVAVVQRARKAVFEAMAAVRSTAQAIQDRVNEAVIEAQKAVEKAFGKAAAGNSRVRVAPPPAPAPSSTPAPAPPKSTPTAPSPGPPPS